MIRCMQIIGTATAVAANAGGTFLTPEPLNGEVLGVRFSGTNWGATADYTLTRTNDGGTVWAELNAAAPFDRQPRPVTHTTAGIAGTVDTTGIPVDGYLQLVVGSAIASNVGTLFIYYRQ